MTQSSMGESVRALDKEYIYIIGSPRSGTTWLQAMIGAHPNVTTTMELTMFTTYIKPLMDSWDQEMRPIEAGKWSRGLPVLWSKEEFQEFLVSFLERAYASLLKKNPQATHILDKNPVNSQMVEQIHWLVPKARFVHIIRDGRDVAISMVAARKSMGFGTDTIHTSARQWKDMVKSARMGQKYADHYFEIRYEDLLAEPETQMSRVFDFCGLTASPTEIADIVREHQFVKMKSEQRSPDPSIKAHVEHYRKGKAGTWQEEMTPRQRYTFHAIAGDLLVELGYSQDEWWHNSALQKTAIPVYEPVVRFIGQLQQFTLRAIKQVYRQLRKQYKPL